MGPRRRAAKVLAASKDVANEEHVAPRASDHRAATGAVAFAAPARAEAPEQFSPEEIVDDGQRFFGTVSRGLAEGVQEAGRRWGLPNAYILGQEASGAFVGGLRYGEGKMYTRNAGNQRIFWQGPSIGFDAGADGDRTMMLVYNLPDTRSDF